MFSRSSRRGCSVELYDGPAPLTAEQLARRLQGKHGLVCVLTDPVNASVLDAATDLKVVANIAVGYDNIDVAAAHARAASSSRTRRTC